MLPIFVKALLRELANVVIPAVAAKATRATISTYSTSPWPVSSVRSATREFLSFCIIDVASWRERIKFCFAQLFCIVLKRESCFFYECYFLYVRIILTFLVTVLLKLLDVVILAV